LKVIDTQTAVIKGTASVAINDGSGGTKPTPPPRPVTPKVTGFGTSNNTPKPIRENAKMRYAVQGGLSGFNYSWYDYYRFDNILTMLSIPFSFDNIQIEPGFKITLVELYTLERPDPRAYYFELPIKIKYRFHTSNNGFCFNPNLGMSTGCKLGKEIPGWNIDFIMGVDQVFVNHLILGYNLSIGGDLTRNEFTIGWLF